MKKSFTKKRILVDFDRVIHQYRKGWNGGKPYDKPVEGAKQAIEQLLNEGWDVIVFTAQNPEDPQRIDEIKVWLKKYKFPKLEVTHTKLSAVAIIDDRAIRFEGNWRSILNYFC